MDRLDIEEIMKSNFQQPYKPLSESKNEIAEMPAHEDDFTTIGLLLSCFNAESNEKIVDEVPSVESIAPDQSECFDACSFIELFANADEPPTEVPTGKPKDCFEHVFSQDYQQQIQRLFAHEPAPPDISSGLGKRQDKRDLVNLARFSKDGITLSVRDGALYEFSGGCWHKLDESNAIVALREYMRNHGDGDEVLDTSDYRKVYRLLATEPDIQHPGPFVHTPNCLNFQDGTLDLQTMEFRVHDPDDEFLYVLNLNYRDVRSATSGWVFESFAEQNRSEYNPHFREQILELILLVLMNQDLCTLGSIEHRKI